MPSAIETKSFSYSVASRLSPEALRRINEHRAAKRAAVIDPVLDFDFKSGHTDTKAAATLSSANAHTDAQAATTLSAAQANAADWLAKAEIKISYAVLDYAYDARGGRIVDGAALRSRPTPSSSGSPGTFSAAIPRARKKRSTRPWQLFRRIDGRIYE